MNIEQLPNKLLDRQFRDYIPRRLENLVRCKSTQKERDDANDLDLIDFHYRRYLVGYRRTLHRVLFELRRAQVDHCAILGVIKGIEDMLLQYELYELLTRHRDAMIKINKILKPSGV